MISPAFEHNLHQSDNNLIGTQKRTSNGFPVLLAFFMMLYCRKYMLKKISIYDQICDWILEKGSSTHIQFYELSAL